MKKGFSLVELIVSIGLISVILGFSFVVFTNVKTSYADPYEDVRSRISEATDLFLNTSKGKEYKDDLYKNKIIVLNSDILISEGLLNEEYYVENIKGNVRVTNLNITVTLDSEGFLNYSINMAISG